MLRATVMMAAVATATPAHPMNTSGTIAIRIVPRSRMVARIAANSMSRPGVSTSLPPG